MTAPSGGNTRWRRVGLPLLLMRVLGQGMEFGGFVFLARQLGTTDFGRLSVAFLICRYVGLVADWGASVRGVRDVAADSQPLSIDGLLRRRRLVTWLAVPGYVLSALALGQSALIPLAVTIASRGLNRDWLALGKGDGLRAGLPNALQGGLLFGGSLLAHSVGGATAVIACAYAAGLAASIVLNPVPRGVPGAQASPDAWLLVAVLAEQVTASTDTVLLAVLRSASEAGIYAAIYRIPNAWMTVIGLLVAGLVPGIAKALGRDPDALTALRTRALRAGLLCAGGVAVTIPVAYALVATIFGPAYLPGRSALVVLLVATATMAMAAPLHPIYLSLGRDRRQAVVALVAAGANLLGNLVMIPIAGMVGAASTTLLAQLIMLVAYRRGTRAPSERAT